MADDHPHASLCPNPECRESMNKFIKKVETTVYGANGQSGLIGSDRKLGQQLEGKISRGWLVGTAISVIAILCAIFIPMITGAIKTIAVVSNRSIAMQVTTDRTILDVAKMDLAHREFVNLMDSRNREVHVTLLKQMRSADSEIMDRIQKGNVELLNHFTEQLAKVEREIEKDIERAIELAVQKALTEHSKGDALRFQQFQDDRRKDYDSIREREIP